MDEKREAQGAVNEARAAFRDGYVPTTYERAMQDLNRRRIAFMRAKQRWAGEILIGKHLAEYENILTELAIDLF